MAVASTEPALLATHEDADAKVASDNLRHVPDQVLQSRLQRGVDGSIADRLPDGGKSYRLALVAACRELERRQGQAAASSAPPTPSPSPSSQSPPPRQGYHL